MVYSDPDPHETDERSLLVDWLAAQRAALLDQLDGLDDEQLATASVPPSDLSLIGLVRHLAIMERVWLSAAVGAEPFDSIWSTEDDPEGDIVGVGPRDVGSSMARWRDECDRTDRAIARIDDVGSVAESGNGRTLRWNLVKLLAEYAGHNGHASLLREAIDGKRGD